MPRLSIPQYTARQQAQGSIRPANIPGAVDVGGLVQGVANASAIVTHQADQQAREAERLRLKQEAETQQLAQDEAAIAVSKTINEAKSAWTEKIQAAKEAAPENAAGFTAQTLKDFDAWTEQTRQTLPELGQKVFQVRAAEMRNQIHNSAFAYEVDARNTKIGADYMASLSEAQKVAIADPSQFQDLLASQRAALGALRLPAEQLSKLDLMTRQQIAGAAANGMIDRDPEAFLAMTGMAGSKTGKDGKPLPSDPKAAAEAVKSNPILSNLKPETMQALVERATMLKVTRDAQRAAEQERRERKAEAAAHKKEREADQAWNVLSTWARDGKVADPNNPETRKMLAAIQGTPYAKAYAESAAISQAGNAIAQKPIEQQRAELAALTAQSYKGGTSPALENEIKARERILSSAEQEYKQEPLDAAASRNVIAGVSPIDASSTETLLQGVAPRIQQAQTITDKTGVPTSPFRNSEAKIIRDELADLQPKQRSAAVAKIAARLGPQAAQAFAAQVGKAEKELGLELAYGADMTTGGRYTSELIARGTQAKKDGTSTKGELKPDLATGAWNAQIAAQIEGVYPSRELTDKTREAAVLIAHGIASEQGGRLSGDDIQRATRLAMGTDEGGLVERGPILFRPDGKQTRALVPLPAGMDEDALDKRLESITPADINAPGGSVIAGGARVPVAEFIKSLPGQALQFAGTGRYAVIVGGRPVLNEKGQPIIIGIR